MNHAAQRQLAVPRILIVGDERIAAMDMQQSLLELGYQVTGIAHTSKEALQFAAESHPDLVLMDIKLSGQNNGIHAADEIRKRWQIPVVYITAYTDPETVESARATAPFGFLVKPYRTRDLNVTISMALRQHSVSQEVLNGRTRLETILGSIRDGVIATDARGLVEFINPAAEQLTGWGRLDAIGRSIEAVYPLSDTQRQPVQNCSVRRALTTGKSTAKERFLLSHHVSGEIPVEDTAAPICDKSGGITGAVTVSFDITERLRHERRQAQAQERLEEEVNTTSKALGDTRSEVRTLSSKLLKAQEDERRRIARELHDDASQRLALLEMEAVGLKQPGIAAEIHSGLERISRHAALLMSTLRDLSHRLYPTILEHLGLSSALRSLVEDFRNQALNVVFTARNFSGDVALETATSLYRIAQEALHNALKYAALAAVHVQLSGDETHLKLIIEDNGPGFDLRQAKERGGLGLLSMQERARLSGGSLLLSTEPAGGTLLVVRMPRQPSP